MSFTLIAPQTSIWYLVGGAIALGRIIAVFGIWCQGRSPLIDYFMRLLWRFST
ncbi:MULTISPECIES: hypothetical protein [unclassified Microcoleus]|uniref:hypothetical protein n=1 Tax=unclassified Microcoleus TaxID=2642155 RepID=UPI002FD14AFD